MNLTERRADLTERLLSKVDIGGRVEYAPAAVPELQVLR